MYLTYEGQKSLIANSNVLVGDCPKKTVLNQNSECKDQEFKGDYFFYSKDKFQFRYCVVDLLKDEVIYDKYVIEKRRILDRVKK